MGSSIWWHKVPAIAAVMKKGPSVCFGGCKEPTRGSNAWSSSVRMPAPAALLSPCGSGCWLHPTFRKAQSLPFTLARAAQLQKCSFSDRLTNRTGARHCLGFGALLHPCWVAPSRSLHHGVKRELRTPALRGRNRVLLCVCRVLSNEGPWSPHSLHVLL